MSRANPFYVVGNGPSLSTRILDALPEGCWLGMNAAYKYWDKTQRYPRFYACLDPVVVVQHNDAIARLLNEEGIAEFFLHEAIFDVMPELRGHPKVIARDAFLAQEGTIPVSPMSRYKQTTGVLATRFCIERGFHNLCLLGIDCNYVERLSEAQTGTGYELVIKDEVRRNPNYFFDNYQEKNEKYQVPNPEVHSGNLHLQSFIALRNDIERSGHPIHVAVGSRASLLSKFAIFPDFDVASELGKARLDAIAVPLMPYELDGFLERLDYWVDPKLQPCFGSIKGVALHIFMSCAERPDLKEKVESAAQRLPWLRNFFEDLRITFLDLPAEIDYYVKGTSLNVFCNKSGPNIFWLLIMVACRKYRYTFLMEADCVPVRPGWLNALNSATEDCPPGTWVIGANYFGPTMVAAINGFHINGNAIYATGDFGFQDYLAGDYLGALQWMVENVSNSAAYDVAFALGIANYQEIVRHTGVDLRKHIWRYAFTPSVRNISGQVETEETSPVDIIGEVRSDPSMFICHGQPALRAIARDFHALDSFYFDDARSPREFRVHGANSLTKFVAWKMKGFGRVDSTLHASQTTWPSEIRINFGAACNLVLGGSMELRFITPTGMNLRKVDVIGHEAVGGKVIYSAMNTETDGETRLRLDEMLCNGNVKEIGVELTFDFSPTEPAETPGITGLRLLHFPQTAQGLTLELVPKDDAMSTMEGTWTDWIRRGQSALGEKFGFIECDQPEAMPILKEFTAKPKAEFGQRRLSVSMDGGATARFRFGTRPTPGADPEVDVLVRVRAGAACDFTLGGKAFGYAAVEEKRRLEAKLSVDIRVKFRLSFSAGTDFFVSLEAKPLSPTDQRPELVIETLRILKTPQFSTRHAISRVISVNPDAESFFGHFLNYEARLGRALGAAGLQHLIAGPVDAEPEVYNAHPEMAKVFTGRTNKLYAKEPGETVPGLDVFEAELGQYLAVLDHSQASQLFMYCGSLEIAEVFGRLAKSYPSCNFAISLYYLSWLDLTSQPLRDYWMPRLTELAASPQIRLIVPSPELAVEMLEGFKVQTEVLPHPTTTFHDHEIGTLQAGAQEADGRLTVVFPGNLRGGKGFDLTKAALLKLLEADSGNLRLRVRFPPADSVNKSRQAFFNKIRDHVEIMDSYLTEGEFRALLLSADIVALPYTPDRFANRTSGLLIDSLLLGVPSVVIDKTWLAGKVRELEFGIVVDESGNALARGILDAAKNMDSLKKAAVKGRDRYIESNSWGALVKFVVPEADRGGLTTINQATAISIVQHLRSEAEKKSNMNKKLLIIGNGPSARLLAEAGLDKIPSDMDTWGTTAAYRYFERVGWWPTYYALADRKVVFHHRDNFARLLTDPRVSTKKFFLSWKVSENPKLEVIAHSSTGSFSLKKAVELGYREIYLIGMEGAYVEEILESRALTAAETAERGFEVLNLSRAESKLRIIERTPTHNPNYFFAGYQQEGDVYSLPQAHTHQANWDSVKEVVTQSGARVINLSKISKIDAFERGDIRNTFPFLAEDCWRDLTDPFSEKAQHVKSVFAITAGQGFTPEGISQWAFTSGKEASGSIRAVFDRPGSTQDRTLVAGATLMADADVKVTLTFSRDGQNEYEGIGQEIALRKDEPISLTLAKHFRKSHQRFKFQVSDVKGRNGQRICFTFREIWLTEAVESVVGRHESSELNSRRARISVEEGNDSFALAIYLYLQHHAKDERYLEQVAQVASRIGIARPHNHASLSERLITAPMPDETPDPSAFDDLASSTPVAQPFGARFGDGRLTTPSFENGTACQGNARLLLIRAAAALILDGGAARKEIETAVLGASIQAAIAHLGDDDESVGHFRRTVAFYEKIDHVAL